MCGLKSIWWLSLLLTSTISTTCLKKYSVTPFWFHICIIKLYLLYSHLLYLQCKCKTALIRLNNITLLSNYCFLKNKIKTDNFISFLEKLSNLPWYKQGFFPTSYLQSSVRLADFLPILFEKEPQFLWHCNNIAQCKQLKIIAKAWNLQSSM